MKKGFPIFCFIMILSSLSMPVLQAQELTGIWRGHFRSNDGIEHITGNNYDDRYKIEVQIAQSKNHLEAITYSYKNSEFYGKAETKGNLNRQTKKVILKELKLLEVRFASGELCIMTYFLQYSKLGNDEYLQGTFNSVNLHDTSNNCGKGIVFLHRVAVSDFHKEPFLVKKEEELLAINKAKTGKNKEVAVSHSDKTAVPLKKVTAPVQMKDKNAVVRTAPKKQESIQKNSTALIMDQSHTLPDSTKKIVQPDLPVKIPIVLQSRTNELLKTITVNHNTIELRIYDDGAIDNDTVSVYYDNKLLISNARLSDQAITVQIAVEPSDKPHELVMVAENLGDIP